jgi:hypothetical protein
MNIVDGNRRLNKEIKSIRAMPASYDLLFSTRKQKQDVSFIS